MCWKCAKMCSIETMNIKLHSIDMLNFDDLNISDFSLILYNSIGLFGEENRKKTWKIMDNFIEYLRLFGFDQFTKSIKSIKLKPKNYMNFVKKIFEYTKNYDIDYSKLSDENYKNCVFNDLKNKLNECDCDCDYDCDCYKENRYFGQIEFFSNKYNMYTLGIFIGSILGFFLKNNIGTYISMESGKTIALGIGSGISFCIGCCFSYGLFRTIKFGVKLYNFKKFKSNKSNQTYPSE